MSGDGYVSSIINNYGDPESVRKDVAILREIIGRQGDNLLLDVIAETCGECANKFKMSATERLRLKVVRTRHFSNALSERL